MTDRERMLAAALVEIRCQLAGYLGSQSTADPAVRLSAHLAYALHNPALEILGGVGKPDWIAARSMIDKAEEIIGFKYSDGYGLLKKSAQQGDAPEPATDANPASRPPSAPAR